MIISIDEEKAFGNNQNLLKGKKVKHFAIWG